MGHVNDVAHSLLLATVTSVIWQGPIYVELHGMGLDLSDNCSAETMTDKGDRNQAAG